MPISLLFDLFLLATFVLKCGLLAIFIWPIAKIAEKYLTKNGLLATFFGHLATFILKVGRLKPLGPNGLRVLWPLSHFFSYKIIFLKINKYIKCGEKSGHLASKSKTRLKQVLLWKGSGNNETN